MGATTSGVVARIERSEIRGKPCPAAAPDFAALKPGYDACPQDPERAFSRLMSIKPELEVSASTVQAIVDGVFAGRAITHVTRIHGGEIAAVYQINFAGTHAPAILKVYPDSLHWKMRKEANMLALVEGRLSVAAPRVLLADDSKRLLALNFILMSKLEGTLLGNRGLEPVLTSRQLNSAYLQIGQLLREFHRISMTAFGYIGADGIMKEHATNRAYLTFQFERKLKEFGERGGAAGLAREVAAAAARSANLLDQCTQPVLCHNDLHAGNLTAEITNGNVRLTGVLDFEGTLSGDPLMDVAKAIYYLPEETRRAVIEGYGDTSRRHWRQTLDLYHLYFVLELWCWMAQIGNLKAIDGLTADLERAARM
jgi:aminoglycoside phosphotransferase (APT) family kinase protein